MLLQMPVGRIQVCLAQDVNVLPWEALVSHPGCFYRKEKMLLLIPAQSQQLLG